MWSRRPSPSRRSRWFSAVVSGTLDLLDGPQVAVRILKEDVARAHRSLGPELLNIAGWDAAPGERLPRAIDVRDHGLDTLDRAGFAERQPLADHNRAGRAGGRHLHHAHPIPGAHVVVEVKADLLRVEGLRGVNVRDGDRNGLELHLDDGGPFRFEMSCAPPCSLKGEEVVWKRGAGDETRTRGHLLGKQALYQLSYSRSASRILASPFRSSWHIGQMTTINSAMRAAVRLIWLASKTSTA